MDHAFLVETYASERLKKWGAPKWPPKPPSVRSAPAQPGRSSKPPSVRSAPAQPGRSSKPLDTRTGFYPAARARWASSSCALVNSGRPTEAGARPANAARGASPTSSARSIAIPRRAAACATRS